MKKSTILGTFLTSLVLLSGCGGSGNKNSNKTSVPLDEKFEITDNLPEFDTNTNITITFWHTMGDTLQTELNSIITDFNKLYPNITVAHEQKNGYNGVRDDCLSNIPVKATPNLAYCYPDHIALYRDADAVQTLDDYITNKNVGVTEEQRFSYVKGFYDEGRSFGDGKLYSLPFVKSTEVLYYDKTFFAQHNLKVPATWEEMWDVCEKIKEIDPKSVPLGYDSESNWFITSAEQYGRTYTTADDSHGSSGHFLFNTTANKNFITDLKTKFDQGLFTTEEVYGKYTSGLFTANTGVRAYMCIGSTGGASYQYSSAFETGVTTVPQAEADKKKNDAVISQGPSICMFKKENVQEQIASWLFLKFLTTDTKSQVNFAKASGYIPCNTIAQNDADYQVLLNGANGTSKSGVVASAAKTAVAQSDMYFTSPTFVGSSQAREAVGKIIYYVLTGEKTVEKAFDDALQTCIVAVA